LNILALAFEVEMITKVEVKVKAKVIAKVEEIIKFLIM
jgi:hypothetical protein